MAHQAPLGLLDQAPLLQLEPQGILGLLLLLHHGQLGPGQSQPLLDRFPLAAAVGHHEGALGQQIRLLLHRQPIAEQHPRQMQPLGHGQPDLGAEAAAADQKTIPLQPARQQTRLVQDAGAVTIMADQGPQPVGLHPVIGMDQQDGVAALLATDLM